MSTFFIYEDGTVAEIRIDTALIRNRFMAVLAEEIMIASAAPSGALNLLTWRIVIHILCPCKSEGLTTLNIFFSTPC
jgi:hypothetical protein